MPSFLPLIRFTDPYTGDNTKLYFLVYERSLFNDKKMVLEHSENIHRNRGSRCDPGPSSGKTRPKDIKMDAE